MKKLAGFIIAFFIFISAASAADVQITKEGRSDLNPLQRSGYVFARGLINIFTSPLEIIRTFKTEREWHPKAWPVSYIPRTVYNFFIRLSSGAYDIAFFPWFVVPFTDDIRPFTRFYDLPDYAFQDEVEEY